jgi:hypothetical protein
VYLKDLKTRIYNCNQRILPSDPVYNSPFADQKIKEAIRTRTLQGMTPEEFENLYKQILYGMANASVQSEQNQEVKEEQPASYVDLADAPETKSELPQAIVQPLPTEKKEVPEKPVLALTKPQADLDVIPTDLDVQIVVRSGHKKSYLLQKCQEYKLTLGDLHTILVFKEEYETNLPTIFELIDRDYVLDQIEALLETRDLLFTDDQDEEGSRVSLTQISRFYEKFEGLPLEPDHLKLCIMEAYEILNRRYINSDLPYYIGTAIKHIIEIADRINTPFLEVALEWISGESSSASESNAN